VTIDVVEKSKVQHTPLVTESKEISSSTRISYAIVKMLIFNAEDLL